MTLLRTTTKISALYLLLAWTEPPAARAFSTTRRPSVGPSSFFHQSLPSSSKSLESTSLRQSAVTDTLTTTTTPDKAPLDFVLDLTDDNYQEILFGNGGASPLPLVLVDCYAPWCGPCHLMEPIMKQLARRYRPKSVNTNFSSYDNDADNDAEIQICRYNTDGIPATSPFKVELAVQAQVVVQALPALILIQPNNKGSSSLTVLEHWTGVLTREALEEGIRPHLENRRRQEEEDKYSWSMDHDFNPNNNNNNNNKSSSGYIRLSGDHQGDDYMIRNGALYL